MMMIANIWKPFRLSRRAEKTTVQPTSPPSTPEPPNLQNTKRLAAESLPDSILYHVENFDRIGMKEGQQAKPSRWRLRRKQKPTKSSKLTSNSLSSQNAKEDLEPHLLTRHFTSSPSNPPSTPTKTLSIHTVDSVIPSTSPTSVIHGSHFFDNCSTIKDEIPTYSPFVPEETVEHVRQALVSVGCIPMYSDHLKNHSAIDHNNINGDYKEDDDDKDDDKEEEEEDEQDYEEATCNNAITHAIEALDKAGNDLVENGDYDSALLRYQRALLLKQHQQQQQQQTKQQQQLQKSKPESRTLSHPQLPRQYRADIVASVATSINNLTYLQQRAGLLSADESLANYFKSLQMKRETLGPNHLSVGKTLNNIGSVFYLKKEYSPALQAYTDALRIMEDTLGSEHGDVGTVISNIGDVYYAMERHEDALKHYRIALQTRWVSLGPSDIKVVRLFERIATLETGQQPKWHHDDVSDSESEVYLIENQKRESLFREDVHKLQEELEEDMKFFDLLERDLTLDMQKDKATVLREIRELYEEEGTAEGHNIEHMGQAVSISPRFSVPDFEPFVHVPMLSVESVRDSNGMRIISSEPPDLTLSPSGGSITDSDDGILSPIVIRPKGYTAALTNDERKKALDAVQSRLASIRAKRRCSSEASFDNSKKLVKSSDVICSEAAKTVALKSSSSSSRASIPLIRRLLMIPRPQLVVSTPQA